MAANQMEFSRGDGADHTFSIPVGSWAAGGVLFFAAKRQIDDDTTDAAAVIQGHWDDTAVSDVIINGQAYKQYACHFPPSATSGVLSEGADSLDLLGEFQYVPASGVPVTFPPKNEKIDTVLYFDVKRKTTV